MEELKIEEPLNMELLGIKMTFSEFDRLMCEQSNGKELKVINGKVIAVEHQITQQELNQQELNELESWFDYYDNQSKQFARCKRLGIQFDKDMYKMDLEAETKAKRIAELRSLIASK